MPTGSHQSYVVLASFAGTAVMAFVAVFQPPPDVWSAAHTSSAAGLLGIGTGGVFALGGRAPAQSVVDSIPASSPTAGGLGMTTATGDGRDATTPVD